MSNFSLILINYILWENKMQSFKLLPVIFFLLIFNTTIPSATIKGYITDSDNGLPLIGADVIVMNTNKCAATDVKGFYIIKDLPIGKYVLRTRYIAYIDRFDSIEIKSQDEVLKFNIRLRTDVIYLDSVTTPEIEAYHKKLQEINKIKPVLSIETDSLKYLDFSLRAFLSMTNNAKDSIYVFRNYDCFTVIKPTMKDSTGKLIRETSFDIDCMGEKTCPNSRDLILIGAGKTIKYSTILSHYDFRRIPKGRYSVKIGYEFKLPNEFLRALCSVSSAKVFLKGLRGTYISSNEVTFENK